MRVLRIEAEADVNIPVRFGLQAVNGTADRRAPIDELEPSWQVNPSQRRSPLAFSDVELEFDKGDLDPEVAGSDQKPNTRD
jgi:hypothetical protein